MDAARLLQETGSNDTAPFFGFIGAASALVFSCECVWRAPQLEGVVVRAPARRGALQGLHSLLARNGARMQDAQCRPRMLQAPI